jgi:hypothetical protein
MEYFLLSSASLLPFLGGEKRRSMVSAKECAELPAAATFRIRYFYKASRMIQEKEKEKQKRNEMNIVHRSVEHGFSDTFGPSRNQ